MSIEPETFCNRSENHGPGRGIFRWAFWLLPTLFLQACLSSAPIVPYDDIVYVSHPAKIDPDLHGEELLEMYSASPNRNPDGLGVLDSVWLQSRITLTVWEIEREREELNKIAYARTEPEHRKILAERKAFFDRHVIFKGVLIAWHSDLVDPKWYLPEGVYIIDDKGRKFSPLRVDRGPRLYHLERRFERTPAGSFRQQDKLVFFGYPILVFPKAVIGPDTTAITLYFAAVQRRMSFTWVFDPEFQPAVGTEVPGRPARANRLWPKRN